jgi:hypothetical protein
MSVPGTLAKRVWDVSSLEGICVDVFSPSRETSLGYIVASDCSLARIAHLEYKKNR